MGDETHGGNCIVNLQGLARSDSMCSAISRVRLGFRGQILAYLNIVQMLFILFYVYVIDHGEQYELGFESKQSRKFCLSSYL